MTMPRVPEPERMDLAAEAAAYAAADFRAVNARFAEDLLDFHGPQSPILVVDLGTGPAAIPILLSDLRPAWRIVALDAAAAMLEIACARIEQAGRRGSILPCRSDAKDSGLRSGSFDLVCSNSILHHVRDPLAFWREAVRLCKPGGRVFLRDLRRPNTPLEAWEIVDRYAAGESELLREEFHRSLLSAYTVEEVEWQLREVGLEQFRVRSVGDRHLDVRGRRG